MKKVLLRFYATNNLGDDLFAKIVVIRYQAFFTAVSYGSNRFLMGIPGVRIVSSRLYKLLAKVVRRVTGINNPILRYYSTGHDLMLYIGGSIFIENGNMRNWEREAKFYQNLNIPYYIIGSNIGPYKSNKFVTIVRDILLRAKDVCLRDQSSYKLVQDLPSVRVATDVAFTLDTSSYKLKKEKTAIFSIIDGSKKFDAETTEKYYESIRNMTVRLIDQGYRVVYMSFCKYEGDEDANRTVLGGLDDKYRSKVEEFNYSGDLDEALSLLASCEIVVGSRFHASILGLIFGKKVLPMAYSDKTTDILKDMKFPGQVVDIRKIDEFDSSAVGFDSIPIMDITDQKVLAEKQFQELDKVLTRR